MQMIELVIKIPEGLKKDFELEQWTALSCMEMKEALMNGTPLPKGHGRLICEPTKEEIKKTVGGQSDFAECIRDSVKAVFDNAPTIIEAEGSESE